MPYLKQGDLEKLTVKEVINLANRIEIPKWKELDPDTYEFVDSGYEGPISEDLNVVVSRLRGGSYSLFINYHDIELCTGSGDGIKQLYDEISQKRKKYEEDLIVEGMSLVKKLAAQVPKV